MCLWGNAVNFRPASRLVVFREFVQYDERVEREQQHFQH